MKKFIIFSLIILAFYSCENQDREFDDFGHSAVYFAYQYPIRTIVLGEDKVHDVTLDNEHKCKIMATLGGVYSNSKKITVDFKVDNSLCDPGFKFESEGIRFGGHGDIIAMPSNYYSLSSNSEMIISKGEITGGIEVQLTDAFFADPLAVKNTYVIPLVMTGVQNADSILRGKPLETATNPVRCISDDWDIVPKDYILYAVKYINPWDAYYLRRGTDNITRNGSPSTIVRHEEYVEYDEVFKLNTLSMSKVDFPVGLKDHRGVNLKFVGALSFDDDQKCTFSSTQDVIHTNDTTRVYNITAKGSGKFLSNGEKKAWGNEDRNAIYLEYEISADVDVTYKESKAGAIETEAIKYITKDTLVVRDRGVGIETFVPELK